MPRRSALAARSHSSRRLAGYAVAAASVLVAAAATAGLEELLAQTPFLLFYLALLLAALYGGFGPALAGVALGSVVVSLWVLPPSGAIDLGPGTLAPLGGFVAIGVVMSWLASTARQAIEELRARTRELEEKAQRLARALANARFLDRAGMALSAQLPSEQAALERLVKLVVEEYADYCVAYAVNGSGRVVPTAHAHAETAAAGLLASLCRLQAERGGAYAAEAVVQTGAPHLAPEITPEVLARSVADAEQVSVLRELGARSELAVPLVARGRVVGALVFGSAARTGRSYDEDDLAVARELGAHVALMMDNSRLFAETRRAIAARDRVLAVVAHDLRSPLQVVGNVAEVLASKAGAADGREVRLLRRALGRAERLIRDLLDLSRLEAGEFPLEREAVDLRELAREACATARALSVEREIAVEVALAAEPAWVQADRFRVAQALENLVRNAVEHAGSRVVIAVEGGREGVLTVLDDGPGVAPEHQGRLFERFWQADRGAGGAGLGLSIVKGIAEAHGGRVWVESRPGEGSAFRLALPLAASPVGEAAPPAPLGA